MSKPTAEELEIALKQAATMREQGQDPQFMAKALLNLNYRVGYLEKVFHLAEKYILFGQDPNEHKYLLKAIEHAQNEERHIAKKDDEPSLGL